MRTKPARSGRGQILERVLPGLGTVLILTLPLLAVAAATELLGLVILSRFVTRMFIDLTLVLGLQIFMGNTNILWFPHVGFMGIGAYASVIFSMSPVQKLMSLPDIYPFLADLQLAFLPSLLAGAVVAAALAAIIGLPLMRLSDFSAVIAGFALLVVIHVILTHWSALTNGPQTLFGVEQRTYTVNSGAWACVFVVIAYLFKESKVGLQLRASREDLVSAASVGVNVTYVRWIAFILSAFVAGIGGGLFAHFITSFTPNAFFLRETFVILAMLVIGGSATVTGAVLGTVVVTFIHQSLRWVENTLNTEQVFETNIVGLTDVSLAIVLILMLVLRPAGIAERTEITWQGLKDVFGGRPGRSPESAPRVE